MDFSLTAAQTKFRDEVRDFLDKEVPVERESIYGESTEEEYQFGESVSKKLVEKNWLNLAWPKEYGGAGLDQVDQALFNQEVGMRRAPRSGGGLLVGFCLMQFGTDEQKDYYLPPMSRGEISWAQGFSEPGGGTDLANLQLKATRDGDDYVLNGEKMFTSAGLRSSHIWLLARTDTDATKHRGISMFLVDLKTPGITLTALPYINGSLGAMTHFEDARIPASALLGQENRGFYQAMAALDVERSGIERWAGVSRTFDELVEFTQTTQYNGKLVWDDPATKYKLAELRVEQEAWRLLCWRISWMQASGLFPNAETSVGFSHGTGARLRFAETSMQILGPFGTLKHASERAPLLGNIQGLSRESLHLHGAGTREVHRNIIAQRGLGMPR